MDERLRPHRELPVAARHQRAEAQLQPDGPEGAGQQAEASGDRPGVHPGQFAVAHTSR